MAASMASHHLARVSNPAQGMSINKVLKKIGYKSTNTGATNQGEKIALSPQWPIVWKIEVIFVHKGGCDCDKITYILRLSLP